MTDETPNERIQELTDSLARTQADYANYRKRTEREREQYKQRATQHLITDVLGIIDHLELALTQKTASAEDLAHGVELVLAQLLSTLEDHGVERIPTEAFNPQHHEALLTEASDEPKGAILEVMQHGYTLGGAVLRTAKVKVSQGPENKNE